MNVRTADLKNNLSRYLRQIRETGETITVCDRDEPIATLAPLKSAEDLAWAAECAVYREAAAAAGLEVRMPTRCPIKPVLAAPTPAPDGRTDIENSVVWMRKERDF